MKYLFNTTNKMDEQTIREMVFKTISTLKSVPEDLPMVDFGFDLTSTHVLANLIDLGVAPAVAEITEMMRVKANNLGMVRISMKPTLAYDLARVIEIGLIRHENGVITPKGFRLH